MVVKQLCPPYPKVRPEGKSLEGGGRVQGSLLRGIPQVLMEITEGFLKSGKEEQSEDGILNLLVEASVFPDMCHFLGEGGNMSPSNFS